MGTPYHSYNCKQSNPNVRRDVEEANRRLSEAAEAAGGEVNDEQHRRGRFSTKSAPASRYEDAISVSTRMRRSTQLQLNLQEKRLLGTYPC